MWWLTVPQRSDWSFISVYLGKGLLLCPERHVYNTVSTSLPKDQRKESPVSGVGMADQAETPDYMLEVSRPYALPSKLEHYQELGWENMCKVGCIVTLVRETFLSGHWWMFHTWGALLCPRKKSNWPSPFHSGPWSQLWHHGTFNHTMYFILCYM